MITKKILSWSAALLLLVVAACSAPKTTMGKQKGVLAKHGMVVSAKEEASKIGLAILKKGGNAFDAMIATELALAVAYPNAGNIGGGGFMVYRLANGEKGALDYREKAPGKAHRDMYLDAQGNVIQDKSTLGALAVGVPGTIDGLFEVHKKFGWSSLPYKPTSIWERTWPKSRKRTTTRLLSTTVGRQASASNTSSWLRLWNVSVTMAVQSSTKERPLSASWTMYKNWAVSSPVRT